MKKTTGVIVFILLFFVSVFFGQYRGLTFEEWKTVLEYGTVQEKAMALEALGNFNLKESETLVYGYLKSPERELRLTAVWALGQLQSEMAANEIVWMLGSENDVRVDGSLVNIGSVAVKPLVIKLKLTELTADVDEGLRISQILMNIQAPEGLVEVSKFLSGLLSAPLYRQKAVDMISQIGPKAVDPLITALQTATSDEAVIQLMSTLATIKDTRSLPAIYMYVSSPSPEIRAVVANALGKIPAALNTDYLISLMRDINKDVQIQAIVSIASLKDPAAVVFLLSALNNENPFIRAYSAYALGEIKDVRAVYQLINLLNDDVILVIEDKTTGKKEQKRVFQFAADALKKIGDPRGLEELKKRGLDK